MNTRLFQPAQFLELGRNRVLARLQGQQFLLRGTGLNDLAQLIPLLDGTRSIPDIVGLLQDRYPAAGVRRTIELLLKRQIAMASRSKLDQEFQPIQNTERDPVRILWIGSRQYAALVETHLSSFILASHHAYPGSAAVESSGFFQWPSPDPAKPGPLLKPTDFHHRDLAVLLPDDIAFNQILEVERLAQAANCPLLVGMATPLGFESLPPLGKGAPCFACTQQVLFQSVLGGEPAFPALSPLRSQPWFAQETPFLAHLMAQRIVQTLEAQQRGGSPVKFLRWHRNTFETQEPAIQADRSCSQCSPITTHTSSQQGAQIFESEKPTQVHPIRTVGIVGGGTAGYLTALALRAKHPQFQVTLIESPDVPIIGVGEATTPLMLQFLHEDLGLDMVDFFEAVKPTLKLGIRFDWGPKNRSFFHYPFGSVHLAEPAVYDDHFGHISSHAMHMTAGSLPVWNQDDRSVPEWDCNIAYHLENRSFVQFLHEIAKKRGITRKFAHIDTVETKENQREIAALRTRGGEKLSFDLYVDCSGFRALLMKKLGTPFKSFSQTLFTNRALIGKVAQTTTTPPYTRATTMDAGWCWNTPQRDAHHCGYVYASEFLTESEAEAEMRMLYPNLGPVKAVHFQSGRHADFCRGNVIAVGNAYGFVEPLESTALHMLIRHIGWLVQSLPQQILDPRNQSKFNESAGAFWDYLCWFLGLHYRFNQRSDSPFWRACREHVDLSSHHHLLDFFRERGLLSAQPKLWESLNIPDPLWGPEGIDLLLLAQNVKPGSVSASLSNIAWQHQIQAEKRKVEQALPQANALDTMAKHPELISQLAACFKKRGPAYS